VPVRVIIADDNSIAREAIGQLLALDDSLEVAASCAGLPALLEAIERETPDVVLTDLRMPPAHDDEGLRVAARLRDTRPEIGVIVVSQYAEPLMALKLLETGPSRRGYLLKGGLHRDADLAAAIKAVAEGGVAIDPAIVDMLFAGTSRLERPPLAELSPREHEVLAELAYGKDNAAIADSLAATPREIEQRIASIAGSLGLGDANDIAERVRAALVVLTRT
jgi:DNA-binding NarL/FixJ family response regulator